MRLPGGVKVSGLELCRGWFVYGETWGTYKKVVMVQKSPSPEMTPKGFKWLYVQYKTFIW